MFTPEFSWPFADVIDIDNTGSHGLGHHFPTALPYPIRDDWYSLSFVQGAGWFHRPMCIADGDKGGAQQALCWSLSDGDVKNYIWRVCWDSNSKYEPVLQLYQEFLHDRSSCLRAGEYLFHTGLRGVWRALKPNNPFGPYYVAVNLIPAFQLDWFKFGATIFTTNNVPPAVTQPPIHTQMDLAYWLASNYSSSISDISSCVDPADMSSGHISTPSSGNSDTSRDASADVSGSDASEAEKVTWGPGRFFCTNEAGEVVLILPNHLGSREAVKAFVSDALSSGEIDGVRYVKCSLCKNKKAAKLWEIKPSNLERHIFTHFGIKCFKCSFPYCGIEFTTKDQWAKHVGKKHLKLVEPPAKGNGQVCRNRGVTSGRMQGKHTTFPSVLTDLPTGGMELQVPNTTAQAIRTQTLITLDDDYEV